MNQKLGECHMVQGHNPLRLDSGQNASINVVPFTCDGNPLEGREGEPLAVALLAAGIRVFRTMPESGEPRGGFCFTGRCADCLMIVNGVSGTRACMTPIREGMQVETQHGLGGSIPELTQ
ncbi:MAG: (2Fe-2S)-binding protein [Thermomicrobiales bacterium]